MKHVLNERKYERVGCRSHRSYKHHDSVRPQQCQSDYEELRREYLRTKACQGSAVHACSLRCKQRMLSSAFLLLVAMLYSYWAIPPHWMVRPTAPATTEKALTGSIRKISSGSTVQMALRPKLVGIRVSITAGSGASLLMESHCKR